MNYIIFGRLLRSTAVVDPISQCRKMSFMNNRRESAIFLIHAGGSGLACSNDDSTRKVGIDILLVGISLNFASFTLFISLVLYFERSTRMAYKAAGMEGKFYPVVRAVLI